MAVLKRRLSPQGYQKVQEIVEADEMLRSHRWRSGRPAMDEAPVVREGPADKVVRVLARVVPVVMAQDPAAPVVAMPVQGPGGPGQRTGGAGGRPWRRGGTNFGRDNYFISFLGQPFNHRIPG